MKIIDLDNNKNFFDLVNILNPNYYQGRAIEATLVDDEVTILQCINELEIAVKLYKWEVKKDFSNYLDSLVCSCKYLTDQQKRLILAIMSNNIELSKALLDQYYSDKYRNFN